MTETNEDQMLMLELPKEPLAETIMMMNLLSAVPKGLQQQFFAGLDEACKQGQDAFANYLSKFIPINTLTSFAQPA